VACNTEKSHLEDDISVISMFGAHVDRGADVEAVLAQEIARKAKKSGSRRTGRSVARSGEQVTVHGSIGSGSFSMRFDAPPQIDHERVYRLAQFHWDALFFLQTFKAETRLGGFFPGGSNSDIGYFVRSNWGSTKARWFMQTIATWQPAIQLITAHGYFKLIIRRSPCRNMYACAVEWNHSMRVMRMLGDGEAIRGLLTTLPETAGIWQHDGEGNLMKLVEEQQLAPDDDILFDYVVEGVVVESECGPA
jgi:uncharacterized ubiquitin-like protein YukD